MQDAWMTDVWLELAGDGGRLTRLGMLLPAPPSTGATPAPDATSPWDGERIVRAALPRRSSQSSTSISSASGNVLRLLAERM